METIVIMLVCVALIVFGVMTMAQGYMVSTDTAALSMEEITVTKGEMLRTGISIIDARRTGADTAEITVENTGQIKLASFDKWDVIIGYHDAANDPYNTWLQYAAGSPGDNEWCPAGIYLDASDNTTEAFEPGILNPQEELKIELKLDPPPKDGSAVEAVISTPNGIQDDFSLVY